MPSPDYYAGVRSGVPQPYVPGPLQDDPRALREELRRLQDAFETTQALIPQVATSAPANPIEGMIRYAKAPWDPLGLGDVWVSYVAGSWQAL
jgi:hypothetical protein